MDKQEIIKIIRAEKDLTLRKICSIAKNHGYMPKREAHKYWGYTFYNASNDEFFALHWKDARNYVLA